MQKTARAKIGAILKKNRNKSLLYSILLSGTKLVNWVHMAGRPMDVRDMAILVNFVTNSQSLRSSESWAPICLPHFSDEVPCIGVDRL